MTGSSFLLALDADFLLRDEMLDDHVCHLVAVRVTVGVQAVHRGEDELRRWSTAWDEAWKQDAARVRVGDQKVEVC